MERWKAREYSKEYKCEVNVRDIVGNACTSWLSLCSLCALDILFCVVHMGSENGADWNDDFDSLIRQSDRGYFEQYTESSYTKRGISMEDRKNDGKKSEKFSSHAALANEIHQARAILAIPLQNTLSKVAPEPSQYCGYLMELAIRVGGMCIVNATIRSMEINRLVNCEMHHV